MKKANTKTELICPCCGEKMKLYKEEKRLAYCPSCGDEMALCDYCGKWLIDDAVELINPAPKGYKVEEVVCWHCLDEQGYELSKDGWKRISYKEDC